jgi:hypothetical protein
MNTKKNTGLAVVAGVAGMGFFVGRSGSAYRRGETYPPRTVDSLIAALDAGSVLTDRVA